MRLARASIAAATEVAGSATGVDLRTQSERDSLRCRMRASSSSDISMVDEGAAASSGAAATASMGGGAAGGTGTSESTATSGASGEVVSSQRCVWWLRRCRRSVAAQSESGLGQALMRSTRPSLRRSCSTPSHCRRRPQARDPKGGRRCLGRGPALWPRPGAASSPLPSGPMFYICTRSTNDFRGPIYNSAVPKLPS